MKTDRQKSIKKPKLVRKVEVSWTELHQKVIEIPVDSVDDETFIDDIDDYIEPSRDCVHLEIHEKEVLS